MTSQPDYGQILSQVETGTIAALPKAELERIAIALCRGHAYTYFTSASFPQVCETVRTLLVVRMSEDANKDATRMSKIALVVSVLSLIVAVIALFSTQSVGILLRAN